MSRVYATFTRGNTKQQHRKKQPLLRFFFMLEKTQERAQKSPSAHFGDIRKVCVVVSWLTTSETELACSRMQITHDPVLLRPLVPRFESTNLSFDLLFPVATLLCQPSHIFTILLESSLCVSGSWTLNHFFCSKTLNKKKAHT